MGGSIYLQLTIYIINLDRPIRFLRHILGGQSQKKMTSVTQDMFIPYVPDSFSSRHDMLSGKGMNTYSICDAPL